MAYDICCEPLLLFEKLLCVVELLFFPFWVGDGVCFSAVALPRGNGRFYLLTTHTCQHSTGSLSPRAWGEGGGGGLPNGYFDPQCWDVVLH